MPAKQSFIALLRRLGWLKPAFRIYEWTKAFSLRTWLRNGRYRSGRTPDGLPVPPSKLMVTVAGACDIAWFLESGRLAKEGIIETLDKNETPIQGFRSILDFGCGCGRVIRHWNTLKTTEVCGTDYNPRLIAWCSRHLKFAAFQTNQLAPPLAFPDGRFDLVYALSVFTHLTEALQLAWMRELVRVIAPGGRLLITTHGAHYLDKLNREEQDCFRAGRLVVRFEEVAGTNLCTAYHPLDYIREKLAGGMEVMDFLPEGAKGNPPQDLILLGKP